MFWRRSIILYRFGNHLIKSQYEFSNFANQSGIQITEPAVQRYLQNICNEYHFEKAPQQFRSLIKSVYERQALVENIKNLKDLENEDAKGDMKELVKEERNMYETSLKLTDDKILELLFPKEFSYGMSECIFDINASVGGQEAMLFTKELLEMYQRYSESRGWSTQLLNIDVADSGGIRHASMIVSGIGVLEILNLEAGVHRVQRVPATEKSGRLHTSTVSVSVLIQPSEVVCDY